MPGAGRRDSKRCCCSVASWPLGKDQVWRVWLPAGGDLGGHGAAGPTWDTRGLITRAPWPLYQDSRTFPHSLVGGQVDPAARCLLLPLGPPAPRPGWEKGTETGRHAAAARASERCLSGSASVQPRPQLGQTLTCQRAQSPLTCGSLAFFSGQLSMEWEEAGLRRPGSPVRSVRPRQAELIPPSR